MSNQPSNQPGNQLPLAIIAAPRPARFLSSTYASVRAAGWNESCIESEGGNATPAIFCEPGTDVALSTYSARWNFKRLGPWKNTLQALVWMRLNWPEAIGYVVCQDDVVVARGLREYLLMWMGEVGEGKDLAGVGVMSCFRPDAFVCEGEGSSVDIKTPWQILTRDQLPKRCYGAQLLTFPARYVDCLVSWMWGSKNWDAKVELRFGKWCLVSGLKYAVHSPSLVNHVGYRDSTLSNWGEVNKEWRVCGDGGWCDDCGRL